MTEQEYTLSMSKDKADERARKESMRFEVLQFALEVTRLSNPDESKAISIDEVLKCAQASLDFVKGKKKKKAKKAKVAPVTKTRLTAKLVSNPASLLSAKNLSSFSGSST